MAIEIKEGSNKFVKYVNQPDTDRTLFRNSGSSGGSGGLPLIVAVDDGNGTLGIKPSDLYDASSDVLTKTIILKMSYEGGSAFVLPVVYDHSESDGYIIVAYNNDTFIYVAETANDYYAIPNDAENGGEPVS